MAFLKNEQSGATVAIVGASGSVGRDLITALTESEFPLKDLVLFTTIKSANETIEVDERRFKFHETPESLVDSPLMEDVNLVFFTSPPEVTKKHAALLAEEGYAVIDIGGVLAGQLPLSVYGIHEQDESFSENRVASTPSAPALLLSRLMTPLQKIGAHSIRAQAMLSAGCMGRSGIEELSNQVAALFNTKEPERKVFPTGLAFDLISTVGSIKDDWSPAERRISMEIASICQMRPEQAIVSLQVLPIFAGVVLCGHVSIAGEADIEEVKEVLASATSVQLADPPPGPRRLVGRKEIYVGRIRKDPMGDGIHFWAAADNLRAGAVDNAIELAHYYWEEGMV